VVPRPVSDHEHDLLTEADLTIGIRASGPARLVR
jgi:hypothetical protein